MIFGILMKLFSKRRFRSFLKTFFVLILDLLLEPFLHQTCIMALGDEESFNLTKPISKDEVFHTLCFMKSFKALGPDGFQVVFYKRF